MNIKLIVGSGTLLALATLIAYTASSDAQPAPEGPPPAPVKVIDATRTEMSATLRVPGTVVSRNDARIASETQGRLSWVAEVGDYVKAGEPLGRIDNSLLQLQMRETDANIAQLTANLNYLQQQYQRQQQLLEQSLTSVTQLDEAKSQAEIAAQQLVQAKAARDQIAYQLDRSNIKAPFSGKVAERLRQPGEFISVGGEVARLVDIENVEIRAQAPLSVSRHIYDDMQVSVRDRDGHEILTRIRSVVPIGDERSRMMELRVLVEHNPWAIGTPVRIALPQSEPREVIAVHRDAVILRENATYVFRVTDDGTVEQVTVTTGIENGEYVEVQGDIAAGDRLVVRGGERLRTGQAVTILADS